MLQDPNSSPAWPRQPDGLSQDSPSTDADVFKVAQEAADRLIRGQSWQDWQAVGRAAQILRAQAMIEARTNNPGGKLYAAAFGRLLVDAKLDKLLGGKEHTALRCRLLDLMDHIQDVDAWWAILPANKRQEWNYPLTIFKHWQCSKVPTTPPAEKPLSPVAKAKQTIAILEEENHKLKSLNGGNAFTSKIARPMWCGSWLPRSHPASSRKSAAYSVRRSSRDRPSSMSTQQMKHGGSTDADHRRQMERDRC